MTLLPTRHVANASHGLMKRRLLYTASREYKLDSSSERGLASLFFKLTEYIREHATMTGMHSTFPDTVMYIHIRHASVAIRLDKLLRIVAKPLWRGLTTLLARISLIRRAKCSTVGRFSVEVSRLVREGIEGIEGWMRFVLLFVVHDVYMNRSLLISIFSSHSSLLFLFTIFIWIAVY